MGCLSFVLGHDTRFSLSFDIGCAFDLSFSCFSLWPLYFVTCPYVGCHRCSILYCFRINDLIVKLSFPGYFLVYIFVPVSISSLLLFVCSYSWQILGVVVHFSDFWSNFVVLLCDFQLLFRALIHPSWYQNHWSICFNCTIEINLW